MKRKQSQIEDWRDQMVCRVVGKEERIYRIGNIPDDPDH